MDSDVFAGSQESRDLTVFGRQSLQGRSKSWENQRYSNSNPAVPTVTGLPPNVTYELPAQPVTTPSGLGFPASGRVMIEELSDNVLLNIFRYYLNVSPQHWPRLAHICRRQRRIVFAVQETLRLRIFCTRGMPVLKNLRCWPAMPIVVQYGGSLELGPPAPKDEDNIVVALKQSGRVSSINLTATSSLLKKLSSIKRPFLELEDLVLLSRDGVLTLPSTFWWGPRLRCLHLTRIVIPILLLYSSTNLVDLQLHEAFHSWQFPIEELTNALSKMTQLQSLLLHFLFATYYPASSPQSCGRVVLPVLTRLDFRGTTEYLKALVARMDAPRLGDIEVTFLDKVTNGLSKLSGFIGQIEMHKSHRRAHIVSSECAISISLIQPEAPTRFKLQLPLGPLSDQLFSMVQLCIQFSALLSNVEDLRITMTRPSRRGDSDYSGWWDLLNQVLNSFTGVKQVHLDWDNIAQPPDKWDETILPSLHKLYMSQPGQRHAPFGEAIASFMISRQLSGHHIGVEYERLYHINEPHGTDPLSHQVTIGMLSNDIFLNIFRCYLDAAPQAWPTLTNARSEGSRLLASTTYRRAIWGVSRSRPPSLEDDGNIITALRQSDRVSSISLTVTHSLLESLSTISKPFLELEELVLLSRDNVQWALPSTFRWGPHLCSLYSTRVAFPSLPQLLSPSHDLVDLLIHKIPSAGYFSPEAFLNALSGMTNLRTLSLHFLSLPPRQNYFGLPPLSGDWVALPALTFLKYRGTSKYLDSLMARIDAPGLGDIDITLFSQPTMDASELGRFIEQTEIQTSLSKAEVQTSRHAISISFTSSSSSTSL
ncbi:hypothetical protein EDB84DRAFT_1648837 [Lactarius hengduanensis]|nr:hypothetical protein EDB84DRAFT_1648837 [Lactarius hengduanensis]